MAYGKELILDLAGCSIKKFNRPGLQNYLDCLLGLIDMQPGPLYFWDYEGVPEDEMPVDQPHLIGTTAIQFITTSNVTIHTLTILKECLINVFSCKDFDADLVKDFTIKYFNSNVCAKLVIERGVGK